MNDQDKIGSARVGVQRFLREFSPRDRVGLTTFDTTTHPIVPIAAMAANGQRLRDTVANLVADGSTSLYDATFQGWHAVDALQDDTRINAVVVLSDGADTASRGSLGKVLDALRSRANGEGRQIRIFTIAYGSDANGDVLDKIAAASGGESYGGDPKTIEKVYLQISSFF
jgi:Ca-activated chloride channel family protein